MPNNTNVNYGSYGYDSVNYGSYSLGQRYGDVDYELLQAEKDLKARRRERSNSGDRYNAVRPTIDQSKASAQSEDVTKTEDVKQTQQVLNTQKPVQKQPENSDEPGFWENLSNKLKDVAKDTKKALVSGFKSIVGLPETPEQYDYDPDLDPVSLHWNYNDDLLKNISRKITLDDYLQVKPKKQQSNLQNSDQQGQKNKGQMQFLQSLPTPMALKLLAYQDEAKKAAGTSITDRELEKLAEERILRDADAVERDLRTGTYRRNTTDNVVDRVAKIYEYRDLTDPKQFAKHFEATLKAEATNRAILEARAQADPGDGYFSSMFARILQQTLDRRKGGIGQIVAANLLSPTIQGLSNIATAFSDELDDLAHPKDETFNIKTPTYVDDVLNSFKQGQSLTRLGSYGGRQSIINEYRGLSDKVKQILELQERRDEVSFYIESIAANPDRTRDDEIREGRLLAERHNIDVQLQELIDSNAIQELGSWESSPVNVNIGGITQANGIVTPTKSFELFRPRNISQGIGRLLDKLNIGTTVGVTQNLDGFNGLVDKIRQIRSNPDYYRNLSLQQEYKDLNSQLRSLLGNFDNVLDQRTEEYQKKISDELDDLKKLKSTYKISDRFQARQQLSQDMNLLNLDTYMYSLPQQLGTSNPFPVKMLVSIASGLGAGAALAAGGEFVVPGALLAGTYGASSISQGSDESFAETYEGTKTRMISELAEKGYLNTFREQADKVLKGGGELQDSELIDAYFSGTLDGKISNETAIARIAASAAVGSTRQYDLNMSAVASDATLDTILMTLPVGSLSKFGKLVKVSSELAAHQATRAIANTSVGSKILNSINRARGTLIEDAQQIIRAREASGTPGLFSRLVEGYSAIGTKLPLYGARKAFTNTQYSILKRMAFSAPFEAAQEGVQNIINTERQQDIYNSEYHGNMVSDLIDDALLGLRVTGEWLSGGNINFGSNSDSRTLAEMNGGFLGALFQSGAMMNLTQAYGTVRQMQLNEFILSSLQKDKMTQRDNIERAASYLKDTSRQARSQISKFLEGYRKAVNNSREYFKDDSIGVDDQVIDDAKTFYNNLYQLSKDPKAILVSSLFGAPGSKAYRRAMAMLYDAQIQEAESIRSKENNDSSYQQLREQLRIQLSNESPSETADQIDQKLQNIEDLAKVSAAIKLRDQYNALKHSKKSKSYVTSSAQGVIDEYNKKYNTKIETLDDIENHLKNPEMHQTLERAQRDNILHDTNVKVAKSHKDQLFNTTPLNNSYFVNFNKQYNDSILDDEKLMDSMQEEYYNRMQREKEIDDYEITPANSVYITGNGVFIAEPVGDGTYVKRRYDREKGEAYGESMPFDKREFVYAKEIEYNSSNVSAEREAEMYEEAQASKDAQNRAKLLSTRNSKLLKKLTDVNKKLQRAKDKSERKGNTKSGNQAKRRADDLQKNFDSLFEQIESTLPEGFLLVKDDKDNYYITGDKTAVENALAERKARNISVSNSDDLIAQFIETLPEKEKNRANTVLSKINKNGKTKGQIIAEYVSAKYTFEKRNNKYAAITLDKRILYISKAEYDFAQAIINNELAPIQETESASKEQLSVFNALKERANDPENKPEAKLTTSQDYFFKKDGKLVRKGRVHSVFKQQRHDSEKVKEEHQKLLDLYHNDIEAYKKYVRENAERYNKALRDHYGDGEEYDAREISIEVYLTDDILKDEGAVLSVARILFSNSLDEVRFDGVGNNALHAGTILDEILRKFFGGEEITLDTIISIPKRPDHAIKDYMSKETFDKLIEGLVEFKQTHSDYIMFTDVITWTAELADGTEVAGQTDMLLIDKHGDIIIVDFKTSKDFSWLDTKFSNDEWTTRTQYSRQQTAYSEMIKRSSDQNEEFNVIGTAILPITVDRIADKDDKTIFNHFDDITIEGTIKLDENDDIKSYFNGTKETSYENVLEAVRPILHAYQEKLSGGLIRQTDSKVLTQRTKDEIADLEDAVQKINDNLEKLSNNQDDLLAKTILDDCANLSNKIDQAVQDIQSDIEDYKLTLEEQKKGGNNRPLASEPDINEQKTRGSVPFNPNDIGEEAGQQPGEVERRHVGPDSGFEFFSHDQGPSPVEVGPQVHRGPALEQGPVEQELNPAPPIDPNIAQSHSPKQGPTDDAFEQMGPDVQDGERYGEGGGYAIGPQDETEFEQGPPDGLLPEGYFPKPLEQKKHVPKDLVEERKREADRIGRASDRAASRIERELQSRGRANAAVGDQNKANEEELENFDKTHKFGLNAQKNRPATGRVAQYNTFGINGEAKKKEYGLLQQLATEPDFFKRATIILNYTKSRKDPKKRIQFKNGVPQIRTKNGAPAEYEIYATIIYKNKDGKTIKFTSIPVNYAMTQNEETLDYEGLKLSQKMSSLVEQGIKSGKPFTIVVTKGSRTNGRVRYEGPLTSVVDAHTFEYGGKIKSGFVYLMVDMHYEEDKTVNKNVVPIALTPASFKEGNDVDLVVDILARIAKSHGRDVEKRAKVWHNGEAVETPLTYIGILKTLIRFGKAASDMDKSTFEFNWVDGEHTHLIEITDQANGKHIIKDMRRPEDVQDLKEYIRNSLVLYANNKNLIGYKLNAPEDEDSSNPFKGLEKFFNEHPEINQIKLSDHFIIDKEDLKLRGIGWMIKHNILMTNYTGIEDPIVSIQDIDIRYEGSKQAENQDKNKEETVIKQIIQNERDSSEAVDNAASVEIVDLEQAIYENDHESDDDYGVDETIGQIPFNPDDYQKKQSKLSEKKLDEDLAIRRVRRMLGRHFPIEIVDKVIEIMPDGYVVGACKQAGITLSTYANQGTEWHEVFHSIVEFLIPKNKRNRIYKKYAEENGLNVEDDERAIAELIADDFMKFMLEIPSVHLHLNVLNTFKEIKVWFQAFRNISDEDLSRTYLYANLGLYALKNNAIYKFSKQYKDAVKRFQTAFNGYLYSFVQGGDNKPVKFKYILNNALLADITDSVVIELFRKNGITYTGSNISDMSLDIEQIRKLGKSANEKKLHPDDSSKWYNQLTGSKLDEEDRTLIQNIFHEFFENWDVTQRYVIAKLEEFDVMVRKNKKIDEKHNTNEDTTSAIGSDLQGHADEFWTVDRRDDINSIIRLMLSIIPDERYSNRFDLMYETDAYGNIQVDPNTNKPIRKIKKDESGNPITDESGKPIYEPGVKSLTKEEKIGSEKRQVRTTVSRNVNSLGYSRFLPFDKVYSELYRAIHNCSSLDEMMEIIHEKGQHDPMFMRIERILEGWRYAEMPKYQNSNKPIAYTQNGQERVTLKEDEYDYKADEYGYYHVYYNSGPNKGKIIPNSRVYVNADIQSNLTQFYNTFKAQTLDFYFTYANEHVEAVGDIMAKTGKYDYHVGTTSSGRSSQVYPVSWFNALRLGLTGIFEMKDDSTIQYSKDGKQLLEDTVKFFINIRKQYIDKFRGLSEDGDRKTINLKINGKLQALDIYQDFDLILQLMSENFKNLGIDIDASVLMFILNNKFNINNAKDNQDRLMNLFQSDDLTFSYKKFTDMISQLKEYADKGNFDKLLKDAQKNNTNRENTGIYLFRSNSVISSLGKALGDYMLETEEFMTVGPENTQMFTSADDHTASYMTQDINKAYVDSKNAIVGSRRLKELTKWIYIFDHSENKGSLIVKFLLGKNRGDLKLGTFIGVNNQRRHDGGQKYSKISTREDFVSKCALLSEGHVIFPTLSDKSTWFFLHSSNPSERLLPGINYNNITEAMLPIFDTVTGEITYYDNKVLDQLIEYAECELKSVEQQLVRQGFAKMEDGHLVKATPSKKQKRMLVKHFNDTGEVGSQGARFQYMLGVWKNDEFISFNRIKDENGDAINPYDSYITALQEFYNLSQDDKRKAMLKIMNHQFKETLKFAKNNKILGYTPTKGKRADFLNYSNMYLDYNKISDLMSKYEKLFNKLNRTVNAQYIESHAIAAYLLDVNARSVMATEEVCRIYTGAPSFFKHVYNKKGQLKDFYTDYIKRLGGLGSTGPNNREDLPNSRVSYKAAEIKDWTVQSALVELLSGAFESGEFKEALINAHLSSKELSKEDKRELIKRVNSMTLDEVKAELKEMPKGEALYNIAERKFKAELNSYRKSADEDLDGINVADGTAFISDKLAQEFLERRGAYTSEVAKAFSYLRGRKNKDGNGSLQSKNAYKTIMRAMISTEKYSAYGYRMEDGIPVHYYNKFALFPLFDDIAYGFTADLLDKMKSSGVDMVMFDSAVKAGSEGAQSFNPDMSKEELDAFTFDGHIYEQEFAFIRRQLNTSPHERDLMSAGTQALKVALATLIKDQEYDVNGTIMYGSDVRDNIMDALNSLSKSGRNNFVSKNIGSITEDGRINVDIDKFSRFLKDALRKRGADRKMLESLDVVQEDGVKRFKTPLSAQSNIQWIESIIISEINREIVDVNLPGNAFYQRSVFGMDDESKTVLSQTEAKQLYDGKPLKAINEEGSMDAVISIDYFYQLFSDKKGHSFLQDMSFEDARKWLIDNNVIGENATAFTMSYRIPTQASSSIHPLRFVDVIADVRDTIILPKEFTKITGSDFDIDKLYMSSKNWRIVDGKATMEQDDEVKKTQNTLLDLYITLLRQNEYVDKNGNKVAGVATHKLQRSIDNDTSLVDNIYDQFPKDESDVQYTFAYGSLYTQVNAKRNFITGKYGIGPFALNNNAQILTMLYDVEFKAGNPILDALNMRSLHEVHDKDGNDILSWLSAMINLHVDVAKDPKIAHMNVNQYTYNITNLLLRTGMGEQTFWFLKQEALLESAAAFEASGDSLVDDAGASTSELQEKAVRDRMIELYGKNSKKSVQKMLGMILGSRKYDASDPEYVEVVKYVTDVAKDLFGISEDGKTFTNVHYENNQKEPIQNSVLKDMIVNPNSKKQYNVAGQLYTRQELQPFVAMIFKLMSEPARALSDTVNYTKIDTKKQGSSYAEQRRYQSDYNRIHGDSDGTNMFTESITLMLDKSFIDSKTNYAINTLMDILESDAVNSIQYTEAFQGTLDTLMSRLNLYDKSIRKTLSNQLLGAVKARFFNIYAKQNNINVNNIFYGNDNLSNKLQMLKYKITNDTTGKYAAYGQNGTMTSPLLSVLNPVPYDSDEKSPRFITILGSSQKEADEVADIKSDWLKMLNDPNEEISSFARMLILYSFFTSAGNGNSSNIFRYLPDEWKQQSGYSRYMSTISFREQGIALSNENVLIDEVVRNNWQNPQILKPVASTRRKFDKSVENKFIGNKVPIRDYEIRSYSRGRTYIRTVKASFYQFFTPYIMRGGKLVRGMSKNWRTGEFPQYVKLQNDYKDYDNPILYKRIAMGAVNTKDDTYEDVPIYAVIKPLGFRVKALGQTYQIYQYGDTQLEIPQFMSSLNGMYITDGYINKMIDNVERIREFLSSHKESEFKDAIDDAFGEGYYSKHQSVSTILQTFTDSEKIEGLENERIEQEDDEFEETAMKYCEGL